MVHFDVKDRSDIPAFFVLSLVQLHIGDIVVFWCSSWMNRPRLLAVSNSAKKSMSRAFERNPCSRRCMEVMPENTKAVQAI